MPLSSIWTSTMHIEPIANHPHLIDTIARWHWDEWGHHDPGGSAESWAEGLRERTHRDRIPTTYVALDGDVPLGSATLVDNDMSTRPDLWPWLAGVYVRPESRGQGVGSALVLHTVRAAAGMGVEKLYLYTGGARGFYEKLGWRHIGDEHYEGRAVAVMEIDTGDVRD
ncbi:MAG TPA: GNAT family N-acetyltransferase [Chloroflexia bacterium]